MSRPLRIQFNGALYHVMSRGNAKGTIFRDDRDRREFLALLDAVATRRRWPIWCYCLMHTHYHVLVETPGPDLANGMQELNGAYAQAFNRRHGRVGHVFQGRYKALLVDRESYGLQVIRYIVRNPVKSGLCADPVRWRWSSHRATLGLSRPMAALAARRVLAQFGPGPSATERYRAFVAMPVDEAPVPGQPNRMLLGEQAFVDRTAPRVGSPSPEAPRAERVMTPLDRYRDIAADRNSAIRAAFADGCYSQAAIARHFGLHYSTVCRLIRAGRCQDSRSDPQR